MHSMLQGKGQNAHTCIVAHVPMEFPDLNVNHQHSCINNTQAADTFTIHRETREKLADGVVISLFFFFTGMVG